MPGNRGPGTYHPIMNTSQQLKRAVSISPKTGLILQEVLGVIAGIKPCLIVGLTKKGRELITREFPELTLECRKKTIVVNRREMIYALSKKREMTKRVINSFVIEKNPERTGELLGYPKCCIKNHLYFFERDMQYQHPRVVYQTHINSQKHSFLTNNLFNFSTRLEKKEDFERQGQYLSLNKNYPFHPFYLQFISHIPCSYDCQESIKIGKRIQLLLKEYAPEIEKVVTHTLSKPVLFFDLFKWVIFDGHVKENTLFYKKVIPPISLIDFSLLNKIMRGNKITASDSEIKISKDNLPLYSYFKQNKTDGFILDFKEE